MIRLFALTLVVGLAAGSAHRATGQDLEFPPPPEAGVSPVIATQIGETSADTIARAAQFVQRGEAEFKAGHYTAAVRAWQHALVDDPKNGGVVLMLSQALLAAGEYDAAAGAAEHGMRLLPADKWGTVIVRYKEIYGNYQDYTDELRRLEKARDAAPQSPALHLLLGYHFGYLGYAKHAVKELDKTLELEPKDDIARKLLEVFKPQVSETPSEAPTPSTSGAAAESAPGALAPEKPAADKPASEQGGGERPF